MDADEDEDFLAGMAHFDTAAAEAAALLMLDDDQLHDQHLSGLRKNQFGDSERRGGYHPHKKQRPGVAGRAGWQQEWWKGKLWRLLEEPRTYNESSWFGNRFRSLFGVPRILFDELEDEADIWMPDNKQQGSKGAASIPGRLKLAATLLFLRSGATLSHAAFCADIDFNTLKRWVRKFVAGSVERIYPKHVHWLDGPAHADERRSVLQLHDLLGMAGCIAGSDGSEFQVTCVRDDEPNAHTGGKSSVRARTYNYTADARGIYHHCHGSHPSSTNDKTMSQFDAYMQAIHNGTIYADVTFELYTDNAGNRAVHKGLWLLTDNGYHPWRCCQYPTKHWVDLADGYWSKTAESVRKPQTENGYGTIAKRWRAFAVPFHLSNGSDAQWDKSVAFMDNCMRFCIMLQNRLLRHDGISEIGSDPSHFYPRKRLSLTHIGYGPSLPNVAQL